MSENNTTANQLGGIRKKLGISLALNWLLPLAVYFILHLLSESDAVALAVAGAIPVVRTIIMLAWRRRVDWIGVLGTVGFAVALLVEVLSKGNPMSMKLYHPVITGGIGFVMILSVALGKPIMAVVYRAMKTGDQQRFEKPEARKRITAITALLGFVLLAEAILHVVLALTLPTATYLYVSRIVTIAMVVLLFLLVRVSGLRRSAKLPN